MKTKDLVYIGIIAYLAFLLTKKKPATQGANTTTNSTTNNTLGTTVGNGTNGGLNLGSNMDLPNLTPTAPNGLSTEVALNSSNVTPIIKDNNEPTQVFGNVSLPTPYYSTSVVNPNPVDIIPVATTTPAPAPVTSPVPIPITSITHTPVSLISASEINSPVTTSSTPISTGISTVAEPVFPIKTVKATLSTLEPVMNDTLTLSKTVVNEIISECGNSFSIPNNDKEGSYTNFWFDGTNYYTQTTSPLIKTIATKISETAFVEGCKKLQLYQMQKTTTV